MGTTRSRFWSWELDRGDYVATKVILVAAPVVAVVGGVVPAVVDWVTGGPLTWASTAGDAQVADASVTGLGGATARFDGALVWSIPDPSLGQRVLALVPGLETALLVLLGSVCLWRLLTQIRSGDPFGGAAVRYVRTLAVLVLAYAVVVKLSRFLLDLVITAPVKENPSAFFTVGPGAFVAFVLGVLLLALAECFRQGARLRADVDGLV